MCKVVINPPMQRKELCIAMGSVVPMDSELTDLTVIGVGLESTISLRDIATATPNLRHLTVQGTLSVCKRGVEMPFLESLSVISLTDEEFDQYLYLRSMLPALRRLNISHQLCRNSIYVELGNLDEFRLHLNHEDDSDIYAKNIGHLHLTGESGGESSVSAKHIDRCQMEDFDTIDVFNADSIGHLTATDVFYDHTVQVDEMVLFNSEPISFKKWYHHTKRLTLNYHEGQSLMALRNVDVLTLRFSVSPNEPVTLNKHAYPKSVLVEFDATCPPPFRVEIKSVEFHTERWNNNGFGAKIIPAPQPDGEFQ